MQDEWISSKKVATLLRREAFQPSAILREYLAVGIVDARAKVAKLQDSTGKRSTEIDWVIPKEVWEKESTEGQFSLWEDRYYFRYFNVRYSSRRHPSGYVSVDLIGLSFCKEQLAAVFDLFEPPSVENTLITTGSTQSANTVADDGDPITAWAMDAARRGVGIRDAKESANIHLGDQAPTHENARSALRGAYTALNIPLAPGRKTGRKSFEDKVL